MGEQEVRASSGRDTEIKVTVRPGEWSVDRSQEETGEWGKAVPVNLFDLHRGWGTEPHGNPVSVGYVIKELLPVKTAGGYDTFHKAVVCACRRGGCVVRDGEIDWGDGVKFLMILFCWWQQSEILRIRLLSYFFV